MSWQFFLALRYLTAKRKEKFISLISLISILGVALGVFSLIIVISVMSGFDDDLKEKITGTYAHIEVASDYWLTPSAELAGKILNTPHVEAVSFFVNAQALIRKDNSVLGVIVKGIVPKEEVQVNKLKSYLKEGSLDLESSGMVIGSELGFRLGVGLG